MQVEKIWEIEDAVWGTPSPRWRLHATIKRGPTAHYRFCIMRPQISGEELNVAVPGTFAGVAMLGTETACAVGCNAIGGIRATDGIIVCEGAIQVLVHIGCMYRAGDAIGEVYFIA